MSRRYFTQAEIKFLKENFVKFGPKYCAEALNRNPSYVSKKAYSIGLKRRDSLQWKVDKSPCKVDMNKFINIINPEIAYILGFLWADGYVCKTKTKISIEINYNDGIDLQKIFLKYIPFKTRVNKHKNKYLFYISDFQLHLFLSNHNYKIKSFASPSEIISKIPKNLQHYFFRGYFDGDGCFTNKSNCCISFTGNINQDWSSIYNFIKSNGVDAKICRRPPDKRGYRSSFIYFYGKEKCKKILEILYQGDEMGLSRKSHLARTFITSFGL